MAISWVVFACVFGGALLGMLLRNVLPEHHLKENSKDVVKLGMALIATMSALVGGLLIASAKSSSDAQSGEVTQCPRISGHSRYHGSLIPEFCRENSEKRTAWMVQSGANSSLQEIACYAGKIQFDKFLVARRGLPDRSGASVGRHLGPA